ASESGRGWESCMTIGDEAAWGYSRHNPMRKTASQLLRNLSLAASSEGNYLLNIGPDGQGRIVDEDTSLLRRMGDWLKIHGKAIYGSERFELSKTFYNQCSCTKKGSVLYLHVNRWTAPEMVLPLFETTPVKATLLTTGKPLGIKEKSNGRIVLCQLPLTPPDPDMCIIQLDFEDEPAIINEIDHASWLYGQATVIDSPLPT
ncbi:MAG: alpha-L-fucosidase, partial [Phycisphaeraceae bacterium JB051]